ncbi:unnamed protein product [Meloidogyne enterolobii]|uniref:Uncharacterized protein n=1 Tax=Meloidogyne enterolobii TaxID=390850 RepID=A0ACB0ZJ87_MELEN
MVFRHFIIFLEFADVRKFFADKICGCPQIFYLSLNAPIFFISLKFPSNFSLFIFYFILETRWDQPKRFYTAEEYAENYTEIAAKIAAKNQSLINSGNVSNNFERNQVIPPNSAPQLPARLNNKVPTPLERPKKDQKDYLKKERKRRWDNNEG